MRARNLQRDDSMLAFQSKHARRLRGVGGVLVQMMLYFSFLLLQHRLSALSSEDLADYDENLVFYNDESSEWSQFSERKLIKNVAQNGR